MQGCTATARHAITWKRSTQRLNNTRNLFSKNLQLKDVMSVNSRLQAIKIIGQKKAF